MIAANPAIAPLLAAAALSAVLVACSLDDRAPLVIEVVPTVFVGIPIHLPTAAAQTLETTRQALEILGVEPDEYELVAGNIAPMTCGRSSPGAPMECAHPSYGSFLADAESWDTFVSAMPEPPNGTIFMMVLQNTLIFDGPVFAAGYAKSSMDIWTWEALRYGRLAPIIDSDHFSQQNCRILTNPSVGMVAHELGHCFGLEHNEGDPDNTVDLMMLGGGDGHLWLKPTNRAVVRRFFRPIGR